MGHRGNEVVLEAVELSQTGVGAAQFTRCRFQLGLLLFEFLAMGYGL